MKTVKSDSKIMYRKFACLEIIVMNSIINKQYCIKYLAYF